MSWVLSGIGLVSALGSTPDQLFAALREGRPAPVTQEPAAQGIPGFDPRAYLERKGLRQLSRTSQLACAAASRLREALQGLRPDDVGVVFGSAWASLDTVVRFEREAHTEGPRFVDPLLFTETVANVPAGQVSISFGWSALNATIAAGSASGFAAIRTAMRFLEEGRARAVVAGGGDELNIHLLRTLRSEEPSEDGRRFRGGEGACLFALESESSAAARGAAVLARVQVATCRPLDSGLLLHELLAGAGVAATEVDLIVLSANGRSNRDRAEATVVHEVFGERPPPAVLPKAMLGETWAAAGPLGTAVALEAMRTGIVPGRCAAGEFVPEIDRLCPGAEHHHPVRHAVVLECPESGHGAALLLSAMGV